MYRSLSDLFLQTVPQNRVCIPFPNMRVTYPANLPVLNWPACFFRIYSYSHLAYVELAIGLF
jgi:hypothetical protein